MPLTVPLNEVFPVTVKLPPTEALPKIVKGALIATCLVPVPDISIDAVVGSVNRFALKRIG
jgi:hypothetical protein